MADLGETFDSASVTPTSFDVLPAGEYVMAIVESEKRQANSGNGEYVALTLEVLEGEYSGRRLWENLNLWNRNETAVQIARGTLSAICKAVSVPAPRDTAELHDMPMICKVAVGKRKDTGEDENRIKSYKPRAVGGGAAAAPTPGVGKKPWEK